MEDLKQEADSNAKLLNKSAEATESAESSDTVVTTGAPPVVVSCAAAASAVVSAGAAAAAVTVVTAAAPSTLLSVHVNNNNAHSNIQLAKKLSDENIKKQSSWSCESNTVVGVPFHYKHNVIDATCAGSVEDEGGGASYVDPLELKQNGSAASYTTPPVRSMTTIPEFVASEEGTEYEAGGAASLTPPCTSQSNRTSISNSTENLSYSSDIFCPDDIILIDNGGIEGEEVSLNSDDCVYAYRGDGTDFELAVESIGGRQADAGFGDDETDFLEMDYEPDPLSEVEYEATDAASQHKNTLLMQRDACNISGRHSANNMNAKTSPAHRQHLGSPISDLPPPKALQSQSMLGKNFARISLHLDQIKGDSGDSDGYEAVGNDDVSVGKNNTADSTPSTAHSLPSILSGNFGREVVVPKETQPSPSKLTGAKPKRLSSTSSTASSKNSSKSRHSSRSFIPIPMGNTSFDDHILGCADFRPPGNTADLLMATANNCDDSNANDEACLDCLERDFLVKTIGKAVDSKECLKCRKRKKLTVPTRIEPTFTKQGRCRIGSPSMFNDEILFEKPSEFLNPRRRPEWATNFLHSNTDKLMNIRYDMSMMKNLNESGKFNQRRTICDSFGGERLLKNVYGTEKEVVTISTVNMNEDALVQALDKLHISYDSELIKAYFRYNNSDSKPAKAYKNMKHFILHQSKKNMNHPKISRLILLATRNQVKIEYTKDANDRARQMTPLKVADVLKQWDIHKNMEILKKLDKRFIDANIIGKIGHIVRQDTAALRQLPEYVLIPQYYTPGYLTITKI